MVVVGYLQTPVPEIMFTLPAARMVLPWWTLWLAKLEFLTDPIESPVLFDYLFTAALFPIDSLRFERDDYSF